MLSVGSTSIAIPSGGAAGQILVKRTGSDYDVAWGYSAGSGGIGLAAYTSGAWFNSSFSASGASSSFVVTAGACAYVPFYLPQAMPINTIGLIVATSAASGATGYMGFSAADPATGQPGTLLISQTFNPTVAATVTAPASAVLPAGWVWASVGVTASNVTVRGGTGASVRTPLGSSTPAANANTCVTTAASPVPVSDPIVTSRATSAVPVFFFRTA